MNASVGPGRPLSTEDPRTIVEDLAAGRAMLEHTQLRQRRTADPDANSQDFEAAEPPSFVGQADAAAPVTDPAAGTAGPPMEGVDRPDPGAAPDPLPLRDTQDKDEPRP